MWLDCNGIANLLSIPQLEEDGYIIDYNAARNWEVTTPGGTGIVFKGDTGLCHCMPYIDLREHREGVIMLETVRIFLRVTSRGKWERLSSLAKLKQW